MRPRRWTIDPTAGSVTFSATSSVHPIRTGGAAYGWFEAVFDDEGFDPKTIVRGRIEVPVAGLTSGNALVDREMKRRIDIAAHPEIVAVIDTSRDIDENAATIIGTVHFLGEEVVVEGEVHLLPGPRLTGIGEFDVRWWGLEPPRLLMARVDPIVTVEIDLLLT